MSDQSLLVDKMEDAAGVRSETPLVTVFMPVYNGERYLAQAIGSILGQSFQDFEFLIINDGSTDRTEEIILSHKDERIRYIPNKGNQGIVSSRNLGLSMARGKYIAVLDSDDVAMPGRLQSQVNFMEQHPEVGACGMDYRIIDGNGAVLVSYKMPRSPRAIRSVLLIKNCICNSSVMAQADLIRKVGYRPELALAEDYDMWYRMSRVADIVNLPEYGINYRIHDTNVSVTKGADMARYRNKMAEDILSDMGVRLNDSEHLSLSRFLGGDASVACDKNAMAIVQSAFDKLSEYLEKNERYEVMDVSRIMIKRVLEGYYSSRKLSPGMLFNGFSRKFPAQYATQFVRFLGEHVTKEIEFY